MLLPRVGKVIIEAKRSFQFFIVITLLMLWLMLVMSGSFNSLLLLPNVLAENPDVLESAAFNSLLLLLLKQLEEKLKELEKLFQFFIVITSLPYGLTGWLMSLSILYCYYSVKIHVYNETMHEVAFNSLLLLHKVRRQHGLKPLLSFNSLLLLQRNILKIPLKCIQNLSILYCYYISTYKLAWYHLAGSDLSILYCYYNKAIIRPN